MDDTALPLPASLDAVRLLDRHAVACALGYPSVRGLERDVRLGRVPAPHFVLGSKARWRADEIRDLVMRMTAGDTSEQREAALAKARQAGAAGRAGRPQRHPLPAIDASALDREATHAAH
jgi:hypothetical protein